MFIGGLLASTGYALAPVSTSREDRLYLLGPGGRRSDPAPAPQISVFHPHRLDQFAAAPSARPMGLRPGIQEGRQPSPPTMRSAMKRSVASRRHSRTAAARSFRKSGRRSAPRISGPISRRIKADADAMFIADGRPNVVAVPQAAARFRQQEADHRRRHQL